MLKISTGCLQGTCMVPGTCVCNPRWSGALCNQCANGWATPQTGCTKGTNFKKNLYALQDGKMTSLQQHVPLAVWMGIAIILASVFAMLVTADLSAMWLIMRICCKQKESGHVSLTMLLLLAKLQMALFVMIARLNTVSLIQYLAKTFPASIKTFVVAFAVMAGAIKMG